MTALDGATAHDKSALAAYPPLLAHILSGKEFGPLLGSADRAKHQAEWSDLIRDLAGLPPSSKQLAERFHTQWHVCHHFLRELVNDDDLLIDMLWVWLPRYQGPDMVLYRGENTDRFETGRIGTAWTDRQATAEMFARGLNAVGKGGVVLRAQARAEPPRSLQGHRGIPSTSASPSSPSTLAKLSHLKLSDASLQPTDVFQAP